METIAVYCEPRIKIYGFHEACDLSLLELMFEAGQMGRWGSVILKLGDLNIRFNLLLIQYLGGQGLRMVLLIECQWEAKILSYIEQLIQKDAGEQIRVTSPVELIYFYGPHFGDRYGIANSAFRALSANAIPILAAGCSSSAIYLVLPQSMVQHARACLADAFEVPQTAPSSREVHS
jgi:aspartokinase